jgi:hypothetical protein
MLSQCHSGDSHGDSVTRLCCHIIIVVIVSNSHGDSVTRLRCHSVIVVIVSNKYGVSRNTTCAHILSIPRNSTRAHILSITLY